MDCTDVMCTILEHARQCMPSAELADFMRECRRREYQRGEHLFTEGSAITDIQCIHTGRVALTRCDALGVGVTTHVALPGEILELSAALDGTVHGNSASAVEPTGACSISLDAFAELVRRCPAMIFRLIQFTCSRIEGAERSLDQSAA